MLVHRILNQTARHVPRDAQQILQAVRQLIIRKPHQRIRRPARIRLMSSQCWQHLRQKCLARIRFRPLLEILRWHIAPLQLMHHFPPRLKIPRRHRQRQ